jgi:hypothetical protein
MTLHVEKVTHQGNQPVRRSIPVRRQVVVQVPVRMQNGDLTFDEICDSLIMGPNDDLIAQANYQRLARAILG